MVKSQRSFARQYLSLSVCELGGYTSDTKHLEKVEEKEQQHETLMKALDLQGFAARLLILAFGVGGTIYKRTEDSLDIARVGPLGMKKLLKDIHLHFVTYLHNIVIQRCHLDSEALRHPTPKPP